MDTEEKVNLYHQKYREEVIAHKETKRRNRIERGKLLIHHENEVQELYQLREILKQLLSEEKPDKRRKPVAMMDENGKVLMEFASASEAARAVGGCSSAIGKTCRNKDLTAYGYRWKYVDKSETTT